MINLQLPQRQGRRTTKRQTIPSRNEDSLIDAERWPTIDPLAGLWRSDARLTLALWATERGAWRLTADAGDDLGRQSEVWPVADPAVEKTRQRIVVQGEVPSALRPPPGCRFHTRCPLAFERCRSDDPPLVDLGQGRSVACHLHPAGSAAVAAAPALATAG